MRSTAEYQECEEIQRRTWNFAGDRGLVPLNQLVAAQKAGGLVLGAFDDAGRLRGFSYGFLGRGDDGRLLHYSHMTAVDADLRDSGLGARIKWAQRDAAVAQGLELMAWTYDPLESRNAYFNFSKLGIVARRYWENLYGESCSDLHRGMPTDRFLAEWNLLWPRVLARRRGERGSLAATVTREPGSFQTVLENAAGAAGLPRPGAPDLTREDRHLLCEIPAVIQEVKGADPGTAMAWREATRAVFLHYLGRGYYVRDCVRSAGAPSRTLYLLERGDPRGCRESD